MLEALRRWRARRVLRSARIPDDLWRDAISALPFVDMYDEAELSRLRDLVVLFLDAKSIVGARGHEVTPLQRVIIAIQACVLLLNLGLDWYDGFENVIVYPGEFVPEWEWEDEAGVVHKNDGALAGESMPGGPVVLSWPDVEASADWKTAGMNLVIHEFAHKIDMRNGEANGYPPLHADMSPREWKAAFEDAYADFTRRVDMDAEVVIDPYAAEHPAEFFAVLSEVFFADPRVLREEYPKVYEQLARFYRQDPAARARIGSSAAWSRNDPNAAPA
ncbi:MAG TPA: M90 family metallopeptidase [Casimicrobiaceae bacterium]|nr:M90 family metallopeptidase [Casimicrobiaceae bacterium]